MKLAVALLLALAAAPTADLRYFHYERSIAAQAAGQTCVVLDATVFSHAASDIADVRLYSGAQETPYVVRDVAPVSASQAKIALVNAGRRSTRTVFDAAMPAGPYGDIDLAVAGQDFLATVTVFGGSSAADAKTRIGTYTIFDFTRQRLGRSTVLHLPPSTFSYLHFEVNSSLAPGQFMELTMKRAAASEPRFISVPVSVAWQQKGRDTVAVFSVPPRVPVDRLLFDAPPEPKNFSRDVSIEIAEEPASREQQAQPAAQSGGSLLRLHGERDGQRIDEERVYLDPPRTVYDRATQWTVTVHNGDDMPLRFAALHVLMLQRQLCFEAASGSTYTLRYGDPALDAPRYDYARWFTPQAGAAHADLGPEQTNARWMARPDQRAFTERHPALLWIALVVVVAVLGFVAVRTARQLNTSA
jgi:hypothetical protein